MAIYSIIFTGKTSENEDFTKCQFLLKTDKKPSIPQALKLIKSKNYLLKDKIIDITSIEKHILRDKDYA